MKHLELRHQVSSDIQEDILNIPNIQELMHTVSNPSHFKQLKIQLVLDSLNIEKWLNLKQIVCYQSKTIIWFELWCQIWNWTVRKIHLKETLSSRNPYIPDMKIKLYSNHFSNSFMLSFSLAEKVQYSFWSAEIKKSISESI